FILAAVGILERLLRMFAFRYIGEHIQPTRKPSLGVGHGPGCHDRPNLPAVSVTEANIGLLTNPRPPPSKQVPDLGLVLLKEEIPLGLPKDLVGRIAKHLRHPRIDEGDAGVGIEQPNALMGGIHNAAILLLALSQRCHIDAGTDAATDLALGI